MSVKNNAINNYSDPFDTTTLTATTVNATTFDTNVTAAGVTLAGTTLAADGTDANISITITPKGSGVVSTAKNIQAAGISFNAGTSTLSTYTVLNTGTWVPTISFAGGTTGITYGTQTGYYSQIGGVWFFTAVVILTSKGSSTGALRLDLPVTPNANSNSVCLLDYVTYSGQQQITTITSGAAYLAFYFSDNAGGAYTAYTNTHCSNTTGIRCSGSLWV